MRRYCRQKGHLLPVRQRRLIGALLAEQNEHWQERRYFNMDEYVEWAQDQAQIQDENNIVAMTA